MPVNATKRPFIQLLEFSDSASFMASCVSQLVDTVGVYVISDEKHT